MFKQYEMEIVKTDKYEPEHEEKTFTFHDKHISFQVYTGCPKKKDTVSLSYNFRLIYSNLKFQARMYYVN